MVFDEADLLLSGAYGAQMRIIWDALRAGDRLHAARRVCAEVRGCRGLYAARDCLLLSRLQRFGANSLGHGTHSCCGLVAHDAPLAAACHIRLFPC